MKTTNRAYSSGGLNGISSVEYMEVLVNLCNIKDKILEDIEKLDPLDYTHNKENESVIAMKKLCDDIESIIKNFSVQSYI